MNTYRIMKKQIARLERKTHDMALLASTERCRKEPIFLPDGTMVQPRLSVNSDFESARQLFKSIPCYVCKARFFDVHHFYHQMCPDCAELNYSKRSEAADLSGRVALVTGGRIKIGYEIALKLLRAGATVMVTTRFKHDAAVRYAKEADFEEWKDRLVIYGLDLRHIPSVESFIEHLIEADRPIDILINNAAQTIRKPEEYYREMAFRESARLSAPEIKLLGRFTDTRLETENRFRLQSVNSGTAVSTVKTDEFGEPVDCRPTNSWVSKLDSVETMEYLEVQVINAMAPFLLNSRLKPLLLKSPFKQRYIVNVSAMEGQFNRENKTDKHPHTNMAKAALNMMTRTSAQDYAKNGIYMNSVDTGWVTQEHPFPVRIQGRIKGVVPPLDCVDGAARVVDPIFAAINGDEPVFGKFLKDYRETQW